MHSDRDNTTTPIDADLAAFGWAPGQYMFVCPECGEQEWFGAKGRACCRACAVVKYVAEGAKPVIVNKTSDKVTAYPVELTYVKACLAALHAKQNGDEARWELFAAVAHAIEAAWPDAVKRARSG